MQLDQLLEELDGVKKQGDGFMARCPAHEDRTASLQISEHEDGGLGVYCHAGCATEAVMASLGHSMRDLMPESGECVYTYRDEQGVPLYDVVRKPGKEFAQRKYMADGSTEWGLGDSMRRVPYRLPEILDIEDDSRFIFIVEGEKDADAFWDRGYPATTNVGGAGKWTDAYSEFFTGKSVCIVQDRDDAGRKHASQVMISLKAHGVKDIRLVEARKGKDSFDHFANGYDVDDFVEPSLFHPLDFTRRPPVTEWLLEDYVAVGDLALYSGPPGIGKSWVTMALAVAMANGHGTFLGKKVVGGRVLYFDEENPQDVIFQRMVQKLGLQNFDNVRYVSAEGLRLDAHPELLTQEVMLYQPKLIVIDSLARVHAKEENSVMEMGEILNYTLKPLARTTGAAVVLIHHSDKGGHGPRGSGDIEAAVDVSIELKGAAGAGEFSMRIRKSRRLKSPDGSWIKLVDIPGGGVHLEVQ